MMVIVSPTLARYSIGLSRYGKLPGKAYSDVQREVMAQVRRKTLAEGILFIRYSLFFLDGYSPMCPEAPSTRPIRMRISSRNRIICIFIELEGLTK